MNDDQKNAFHRIWNSVTNNEGKIFFVDGPGGTGKTYLYELICHVMRAQGLIVSMFKIPIDSLDIDSICNIPKESLRADLLRAADIIIFQDLRNCPLPFGGLTVIFGGDPQQILPVVRYGSRADTVEASLQRSYPMKLHFLNGCLMSDMDAISMMMGTYKYHSPW